MTSRWDRSEQDRSLVILKVQGRSVPVIRVPEGYAVGVPPAVGGAKEFHVRVFPKGEAVSAWMEDFGGRQSHGPALDALMELPLRDTSPVVNPALLPPHEVLVAAMPEAWTVSWEQTTDGWSLEEQGLPLVVGSTAMLLAGIAVNGEREWIYAHTSAYDAQTAAAVRVRHEKRIAVMSTIGQAMKQRVQAFGASDTLPFTSPLDCEVEGWVTRADLELLAGHELNDQDAVRRLGRWTEHHHNVHMMNTNQPADWVRGTLVHDWYRLWTVELEPGWHAILSRSGAQVHVTSLAVNGAPSDGQLDATKGSGGGEQGHQGASDVDDF